MPAPTLRALIAALALAASAAAQPSDAEPAADEPRFDLGLLAFGDGYWVAQHHDAQSEDVAALWLRRAYLTFDYRMTTRLSGRLRFEVNQDGEFSSDTFEIDYKDIHLKWRLGDYDLLAGLAPAPTFDLIEEEWGYRWLEKTPQDLQGIPSRDTGISSHGPITKNGSWSYRAMYGSGIELGSDSSDSEKLMAGFAFQPPDGTLTAYLYADIEEPRDGRNRSLLQGFLARRTSWGRFGLLYFHQDRQGDPTLEVASGYAVADLNARTSVVARIDRLLEPSVRAEGIDYLPFDGSARATLYLVGVDLRLAGWANLSPNVEVIAYDHADDGVRPNTDVIVRLSFFLRR
jgi:hypothetical protein